MGRKSIENFYTTDEKYLNLENKGGTYWGNLGYWDSIPLDYSSACYQLARQLGNTAYLESGDTVIDIGFGCGDQLLTWINDYQVRDLFGINVSQCQTSIAKKRVSLIDSKIATQLVCGDVANILTWHKKYRISKINKILALDCAYHFTNKTQFLRDSYSLLEKNGCVTLCDLVLAPS